MICIHLCTLLVTSLSLSVNRIKADTCHPQLVIGQTVLPVKFTLRIRMREGSNTWHLRLFPAHIVSTYNPAAYTALNRDKEMHYSSSRYRVNIGACITLSFVVVDWLLPTNTLFLYLSANVSNDLASIANRNIYTFSNLTFDIFWQLLAVHDRHPAPPCCRLLDPLYNNVYPAPSIPYIQVASQNMCALDRELLSNSIFTSTNTELWLVESRGMCKIFPFTNRLKVAPLPDLGGFTTAH